MKHKKILAVLLSFAMVMPLFCSCRNGMTNLQANLVAADTIDSREVVVVKGDQRTVIEDTAGLTIEEILKKAGIVIDDTVVISLDKDQMFDSKVVINVLNKSKVTFVIDAGTEDETTVIVSLVGGTVADALEAAGYKPSDIRDLDVDLDSELADGMSINMRTVKSGDPEETTETTETTETSETSSTEESGNKPTNTPKPTKKPDKKPTTTPKPTKKPTNTPKPTKKPTATPKPTKTVVKTEYYEDCDGSGHGVKIITYSDGTQKEIPY